MSSRTEPMNWRITPRPPLRRDRARRAALRSPVMIRSSVVLPGAVGADQRDLGALADPERDVVEQHPPVRAAVAHPVTSTWPTGGQSPDASPGPQTICPSRRTHHFGADRRRRSQEDRPGRHDHSPVGPGQAKGWARDGRGPGLLPGRGSASTWAAFADAVLLPGAGPGRCGARRRHVPCAQHRQGRGRVPGAVRHRGGRARGGGRAGTHAPRRGTAHARARQPAAGRRRTRSAGQLAHIAAHGEEQGSDTADLLERLRAAASRCDGAHTQHPRRPQRPTPWLPRQQQRRPRRPTRVRSTTARHGRCGSGPRRSTRCWSSSASWSPSATR